jgi:GNAT superfamily N-acetyltransferase
MNCVIKSIAGGEDLALIKELSIAHAMQRLFSGRRMAEKEMQDARTQDLEDLEKVIRRENARVYGAMAPEGHLIGFVIVKLAAAHIITGEFQAEIDELFVKAEYRRGGVGTGLMEKAERFVQSKSLKYLSSEILAENLAALSFLHERGYHEEVKIMMKGHGVPRENEYPEYPVRFAKTFDFPKIRALAVESIVHSMPAGHACDEEMLRERSCILMTDPVRGRQSKDCIFLIAESLEKEFLGFLLAEREKDLFCRTPQIKVLNIAVRQPYWGKKVAHALFNHLLRIGKEDGCPCITGVIATANRRSWLFFERAWKAAEERKIMVKNVAEND